MAGNERFDDSIGRWLEETAPSRLPQRVLDATFDRTRRTRQDPAWRAVPGRLQMPRFVPALGGAAVIVLATVLALDMVPLLGTGASPSPSPSATPPPTAPPSPTAIQTPDQSGCFDLDAAGGAYRATVGTISVSAKAPPGWTGSVDGFALWNNGCLFGGSVSLDVTLVGRVYADACDWFGTDVEVRTPAAAIAALVAQKGHQTTGPADVKIAGFDASRFEFSVPSDFDARSECYEGGGSGSIALWTSPGDRHAGRGLDPGQTLTVYLVDVDGSAIAVVADHSDEDTTPADIAELDAVIASLQFEP